MPNGKRPFDDARADAHRRRTEFKILLSDLRDRYVTEMEGQGVKPWLQFDTAAEAVQDFLKWAKTRTTYDVEEEDD